MQICNKQYRYEVSRDSRWSEFKSNDRVFRDIFFTTNILIALWQFYVACNLVYVFFQAINWKGLPKALPQVFLFFTPLVADICIRKVFEPHRRGFFCNDQSLMYPYRKNTVTALSLLLIMFLLPLFLFFLNETFKVIIVKFTNEKKIFSVLKRTWYHYRMLLFTCAITWLLTDILKYGVGRLRPHFFEVCGIVASKLNCSNGFIDDIECKSNFPSRVIKEARFSFPSGHASLSTSPMFFCAFYLHDNWRYRYSDLFRPLVQILLICIALICSWTRITDNMHHPTDVLFGIFIGVCVAIFIYFVCTKRSKLQRTTRDRRPQCNIPTSNSGTVLNEMGNING